MWKDVYILGEIFGYRFIVRNQWHKYTSSSDLDFIRLAIKTMMDRTEVVLSIFGFSLTAITNRLKTRNPPA